MDRLNWLALNEKLIDATDLDYTLNAIVSYIAKTNLAYFGEGVVVTTTYPNPFPITLSSSALGGSVGSGIAYDPTGLPARIDDASTSNKSFTIAAADASNPRFDLLVLRFKTSGKSLIPKPSDPLTTVPLYLIDDFELATVLGVPNASPAYPAKGQYDVILAGLRVPASATNGSSVAVDLGIREIAQPAKALYPVFNSERPVGVVDKTNKVFTLSAVPLSVSSLAIRLNGRLIPPADYTLSGQTVTFTYAPEVGQEPWARYIANSPNGQNPIDQVVETPSGTSNGSNPNFVLAGKPAARSSLEVYVDGILVPPSSWNLLEGVTAYTIQFNLGAIPQIGQSVEAIYLVNASTLGAAPSSGGGSVTPTSGGGYKVFGSPSNPNVIGASTGVAVTSDLRQYQYVGAPSGSGALAITASPQIGPGSTLGQELVLRGTSDADYPQLQDGSGVSLNGACSLTSKQTLALTWNGTLWDEVSRRL